MLPVSTPQNAIVYGSGVVPITKMIRSGFSFDILGAILILLLLPLMVAVLGSRRLIVSQSIAVIPGDGIGPEVVTATRTVLDALAEVHGLDLAYDEYDWSCRRYAETRHDDARRRAGPTRPGTTRSCSAPSAGPGVPDHVSLWGLLIPIRRTFRQYVNLRPIAVFEGVESPLRGARPARSTWSSYARTSRASTARSAAGSTAGSPTRWPSRSRCSPASASAGSPTTRSSWPAAARGYLTSATKSNGIVHTLPFWDEVVAERAAEFPDVRWDQEHIDALAAKLVLQPERFDVIVASNLFGDILSDLSAAVAGSIGLAPSANLDPTREHPSMFEPVHGSAPDIAGQGVANPVGTLWSAALMLEHLGHAEAGDQLMAALRESLRTPTTRTGDLGGSAVDRRGRRGDGRGAPPALTRDPRDPNAAAPGRGEWRPRSSFMVIL